MFSTLVFASFLMMMVSSVVAEDPYSVFPAGCHDFKGKVSCANGQAVLPSAQISLYEMDDFTKDDLLSKVPVTNGLFYFHICATDFPTPNLELYLRFKNICKEGGSDKHSGTLKEKALVEYVVYDDERFPHTAINDKN